MNILRKCRICNLQATTEKELELFSTDNTRKYGKKNLCKSCSNAKTTKWKKENKEKVRDHATKYKYGINLLKYSKILETQEHKCKICGTDNPGHKGKFVIDHCHKHGHVRGLLCNRCNIMLGFAKDDTDILANAITYLKNSE